MKKMRRRTDDDYVEVLHVLWGESWNSYVVDGMPSRISSSIDDLPAFYKDTDIGFRIAKRSEEKAV
jgi:hypothetical protein